MSRQRNSAEIKFDWRTERGRGGLSQGTGLTLIERASCIESLLNAVSMKNVKKDIASLECNLYGYKVGEPVAGCRGGGDAFRGVDFFLSLCCGAVSSVSQRFRLSSSLMV